MTATYLADRLRELYGPDRCTRCGTPPVFGIGWLDSEGHYYCAAHPPLIEFVPHLHDLRTCPRAVRLFNASEGDDTMYLLDVDTRDLLDRLVPA